MINNILLFLLVICMIVLAGLIGGAEIGLYQLSRLRLRLQVEKKRFLFIMLSKVVRDSSSMLLTILVATNIIHYLTTSIIIYVLVVKLQIKGNAEFYATLITAPILFVYCELVPKNIFFYRADSILPVLSPMLFTFHKLLSYCGIVPLLRAFANFFARLTGSHSTSNTIIQKSQRHHIDAILKDTLDEGLLSSVQSDIINRIVSIPTINLRSVMIPINKTQMVPITSNKALLINRFSQVPFTRLLVYDHWKSNIVGFIEIYDCLGVDNDFNNLNDFIKPIRKIKANTSFTQAVKIMQTEKHKIAMITKTSHRHKPLGIVTMKDLVEELFGELVEW